MSSLLHLDSSANRSGESVSRQLTRLYAERWLTEHGPAGYHYRDLAAEPIAPLTTPFCALGRRVERHGYVPLEKVATYAETAAEEEEWGRTLPLIKEVIAADTILIGAPMYNYSVSALLKSWIDRVSFPNAFKDRDTGTNKLLNTQIVVMTTTGGSYQADNAARDFQTPYLTAYFNKQGVPTTNITFITTELTLANLAPHLSKYRPAAKVSLASAVQDIIELTTPRLTIP